MSEIEELRAEVERLRGEYLKAGSYWDERNDRQNAAIDRARMERAQAEDAETEATERAEAAEAALASEREAHAGLRARLEALADEHDHCSGCPTPWWLWAALAAEPAAPVAAEEGGER